MKDIDEYVENIRLKQRLRNLQWAEQNIILRREIAELEARAAKRGEK